MAILPHDGPDAGSDNPAVDLKRTLLTNVSNFKSVSKTNAWIDEMMALREDAEEADAIGFCSRIFTQLSLPYRDPGASGAITWVRQRRFKQSFTSKLILISLVYPEAVFKEVDKGLMIYPSPSPLGRKRLPRPERAAAKWMGKK